MPTIVLMSHTSAEHLSRVVDQMIRSEKIRQGQWSAKKIGGEMRSEKVREGQMKVREGQLRLDDIK